MEDFNAVPIVFNEKNVLILNFLIGLIMYGIALDLKWENFTYVYKNRNMVWIGLLCQFLLLPALTFVFILLIQPPPSIALGLILVAACPGGNVSNFAVYISKANTALSITLTSIATLLATIATPLNFALWSRIIPNSMYDGQIREFSLSFIEMFKIIFLITAVPIALGMLTQRIAPKFSLRMKKPMNIISLAIFFGFIIISVYSNFDVLRAYILDILWIVIGHNISVFITAFIITFFILKLKYPEMAAITIETSMQNTGLAFVIIFGFMDANAGMLLIAALWGIWHMVAGLGVAELFRRYKSLLEARNG